MNIPENFNFISRPSAPLASSPTMEKRSIGKRMLIAAALVACLGMGFFIYRANISTPPLPGSNPPPPPAPTSPSVLSKQEQYKEIEKKLLEKLQGLNETELKHFIFWFSEYQKKDCPDLTFYDPVPTRICLKPTNEALYETLNCRDINSYVKNLLKEECNNYVLIYNGTKFPEGT